MNMKKIGIKELSIIFEVSEQTIRFYDSKGLFPFLKRQDNNYRYACVKDLQWFKMVFLLKKAGMEIKQIQRYITLCFEGDKTVPERLDIIVEQKKALKSKIKDLEEELRLLSTKEEHYKKVASEAIVDDWNPINYEKILKEKNIY